MSTPPQHGQRACYLRGCRRDECRDAHYRYMSRYRYDRHRGQKRRVEAERAAQHIDALLAAGWNLSQIAAAAGRTHRIIGDIASRRQANVTPGADRAICAVTGPPPERRDVDATGTIRRIRALYVIGHTLPQIAAHIGIHPDRIGNIARGQSATVRATTANATTAAYKYLSRVPGTSLRARTIAARNGWHGPLAWDLIDDPDEQPDTTGTRRRAGQTGTARGPVDADEVLRLTSAGRSAAEIAANLRCAPRSVTRIRARHAQPGQYGEAA